MAVPVRDPHRDRRHQRHGERAAGRRRRTARASILLTEAVATLVAGVCGGVSQTTPVHRPSRLQGDGRPRRLHAGHRRCSSGWAGSSGYIPFLAMILPIACLAPILIFVAFDIVAQAFQETPRRARGRGVLRDLPVRRPAHPHHPRQGEPAAHRVRARAAPGGGGAEDPARLRGELRRVRGPGPRLHPHRDVVGRGAGLPDRPADRRDRGHAGRRRRRCRSSASSTPSCPTGGIYLPWSAALLGSRMPYHWAAAYAAVALMVLALGRVDRDAAPAALESP